MDLRKGGAFLVIASLASPVLADAVLPIGGAFGNEAGCAFFMTGAAVGNDPVVITPDTLTMGTSSCYFEALVSRDGPSYVVEASCRHDGAESRKERVVVTDRRDAVFVRLESIGEFGPFYTCPGTEDLFAPPGTQV